MNASNRTAAFGSSSRAPRVAVVGSVNLDIVASAPRLPLAGETITDATLARHPGGKGANQALAARRLGAEVFLYAAVGNDAEAEEALRLLAEAGVDLSACIRDTDSHTGIALIVVAASGENQIVVAPGANRSFHPDRLELRPADALICQLEVPLDTVQHATTTFDGFVCVNLAPARPVPAAVLERADLIVVNETESAALAEALKNYAGLLATTYGAAGAELHRSGQLLARARSPAIEAVDTTGAGDTFTAALTVELVCGREPEQALEFACAAGALAAMHPGAQPSIPRRAQVFEAFTHL